MTHEVGAIQRILDAYEGHRGPEQQSIATTGLAWLDLLLAKNSDYGGSAWKRPVLMPGLSAGDAILVRMSDKIERLSTLMEKGTRDVDESVEDTVADLGAYCLLWLARPDER